MLVLNRKRGEVIHIGDDIVLKVIEVRHGRVRIGIEAPQSCRILRQEVVLELPMTGFDGQEAGKRRESQVSSRVSRHPVEAC